MGRIVKVILITPLLAPAAHGKPSVTSAPAATMDEPEKVECFRISLAPLLAAFGRKPPERDKPCLFRSTT